jgi:glycosyltransferase involved in cell wall biosynthesis
MDLGQASERDLESIWRGQSFAELRERFRAYRVRADECRVCVEQWLDGMTSESPAVAEFDGFPLPAEECAESPRALGLDLRAVLPQVVAEGVYRWLDRLTRLHVTVGWPPIEPQFQDLVDRVSALPADRRPRFDLRVCDAVPDPKAVPAGVRLVELCLSMETENPSEEQDQALESLGRALRERGVGLVLEVPLHQRNWIHLRSWLARARRLGAIISPRLVSQFEKGSLGELDGDALASVHDIFQHWFLEYPLRSDQTSESRLAEMVLRRLRRWQREAASRAPSRDDLILPNQEHSLLKDESALEAFLGQLLRIYNDPHIERWLSEIVLRKTFAEEARRRRSLRTVALWLACVFNRSETLLLLRDILKDPEDATRIFAQDEKALAGTLWEGWFRGWIDQLRLRSLGSRERRMEVRPARRASVSEEACVTVIIPSYNHETFVGDAVRSVLAQTRTDFQLLVVDDASPDQTFEEAAKFQDQRIRVIRNPWNMGLGPSLARALDSIKTEFVALLNSDDMFEPRRLEACLARLEENPRWNLVATALAPMDRQRRFCSVADSSPVFDGPAIHNWLRWYEEQAIVHGSPGDVLGTLLERNFLITSSNLVARTDFLRRHQDAWRHLEFCLDWQIFLIAALENSLCYVPDDLLGYRLHQTNTVWFDPDRRWRYYLESNQVVARLLERLLHRGKKEDTEGLPAVIRAISDHLTVNTNIDWPGVLIGFMLERLELHPRQLDPEAVALRLQALDKGRAARLENEFRLRDFGDNINELYRIRSESPYLRSVRNSYEALQDDHHHLRAETMALLLERANSKVRWQAAEAERHDLQGQLTQRSRERDDALLSYEHRLGDLLFNRLRLAVPLLAASRLRSRLRGLMGLASHAITRCVSWARGRTTTAIVAATGRFPIYSHTFVYQELMGLREMGFDVRLFYWIKESPEGMHKAYMPLLRNSVKLLSIREDHARDKEYCKRAFPGRLEALLDKIARCTGRTITDLEAEYEIMQACTFARTARSLNAQYVHTYFFYEQSLFGMVTAWLLEIPRGITAYADHTLNDYAFKLVALHLETADVIVATSHKIKRELLDLGGQQFAEKILVKQNGVDGRKFPFRERPPNSKGPLEVISVSRIEPKKGLLTLIDAARILHDSGRQIRFHVVGTGDPRSPGSLEFEERFLTRLSEPGVREHFVLHGFKKQEELVTLLDGAHVFVAPYVETSTGDKDGIPTALLEAMAAGLPSVASNAGSILEVIDDGKEGLIVPQGDAVRLAEALRKLMDDPPRIAAMGRLARKRFEREFDCRVTEEILHERINELLQTHRSRTASPRRPLQQGIR